MIHDIALPIHIAAGAAGLVLGPVAMLAGKRRGAHTRAGEIYFWVFTVVVVTAILLSALNWDESWFLTPIAVFSYAFAIRGYAAAKRRRPGWLAPHIAGQGGSYIALVTAFLVVNLGDALYIWFIPTIVGSPVIAWVQYQVATGKRPKGVHPSVGRRQRANSSASGSANPGNSGDSIASPPPNSSDTSNVPALGPERR